MDYHHQLRVLLMAAPPKFVGVYSPFCATLAVYTNVTRHSLGTVSAHWTPDYFVYSCFGLASAQLPDTYGRVVLPPYI